LTQLSLLTPARPQSLTEAVAALFLSRPGEWIDMHQLARVGGTGGWRTRLSDCRKAPFHMTIVNRNYRTRLADGRTVTVSEYRWISGVENEDFRTKIRSAGEGVSPDRHPPRPDC
jgi:hypothetical protein